MKKSLLAVGLALFCTAANAQNSAIYKAQAAEQKGDITEAINILETALQNPKTTKFAEIYNMAAEDHAKIFNNELNKAAQQMPFDTVAFTTHLDKAIDYYTKSHEANIKPDEKGRVKVDEKIQFANHMRLGFMLDYYNYAAMFMYQRGDTVAAINYFEKYLDMPKNPIFSQQETDSIYADPKKKAGYTQTRLNIAMLQFNRKNWDEAIKYADEALKDTLNTRDLYIIKMQSYLAKNDSASYLTTLAEAIGRTEDEGFMQNLLYYYVSKNDVAAAEKMANELITAAPEKKSSWYMKGCVELNLKKDYAAAREDFAKALAIDPNFTDANVNMAYTYMNEGREVQLSGKFKILGKYKTYTKAQEPIYKKELAEVRAYYENARPYMEKVRELTPDEPRRWAYSLQMIYENLGMKDKKAEIDEVLKGI